MWRDLLTKLYLKVLLRLYAMDRNPGASTQSEREFAPQTPLRYAAGALGGTGDNAARCK